MKGTRASKAQVKRALRYFRKEMAEGRFIVACGCAEPKGKAMTALVREIYAEALEDILEELELSLPSAKGDTLEANLWLDETLLITVPLQRKAPR